MLKKTQWIFTLELGQFGIVLLLAVFLGLSGFASGLYAQQGGIKVYAPVKNYKVFPASSRIKVDGVLDDAAWNDPGIDKITDFYEWSPGDGNPMLVKTEGMITFDKSRLYIAFRCYDPEPQKIRAHLMDRDSISTFVQDDHVSIMLDTFNDERRAFQFHINPLGVQADGIFSELEGYEDFSWDAIWKSAAKITDTGYVVEISIPFNQLRFPKDKGPQTWGFELGRSYPRLARYRGSSFARDKNKSCLPCQFNKITGFKDISPGKNLEFAPTLTAQRTDRREDFPSGELEKGKTDVEPGISGRWGVTPNLILNATVNPDFSQVEADVAQLDVNTRFALRFPEKRPFFLEGADFFLTPLEAVFTRSVFNPVWGAKMTGKLGKNAVGLFITQDRYTNLIFPSNQGSASVSLDDDVFGGVFRFRRDVGKGSTVGILYTGKSNSNYYNHLVGADGFFRFSKTKTLSIQY
ncbi:MAG: carbohydrate binding family 9 domain-containing protein, partial [bacterium]|nr:carbohydrate binding family 9 domain-containing protein [bacterium]